MIEGTVWKSITELLCQPDQLRADLDAMIEQEQANLRDDPNQEARTWLEKLEQLDRQRDRAQDLAIEGLLSYDELRSKLADLEDARRIAERELETLSKRREKIEELKRDRDALLTTYVGMAPEVLDALQPEERHQLYRMLRLRVVAGADGSIEVNGALGGSLTVCKSESTSL